MKFAAMLFLFISLNSFSQETQKRILFRGDSIWYAGENQLLFSSTNKGVSWDTAFAKTNPLDTFFINGVLDTATNVFISDQRTLFVFGWDGTMHYKTILYSSFDHGKTWNKLSVYANQGLVGVKYLHKVSQSYFILDRRKGLYSVTEDSGKTWKSQLIWNDKYSCADEGLTFLDNGHITYSFSRGQKCKHKVIMVSVDNGKTWIKTRTSLYVHPY